MIGTVSVAPTNAYGSVGPYTRPVRSMMMIPKTSARIMAAWYPVPIRLTQNCWKGFDATHREDHARSGVDTRVGVPQRTIEDNQNRNEGERSPHPCCHRSPGIGVAGTR